MEVNMCYNQFTISKDEWDTKEDTGKSMKTALYVYTTVCHPSAWSDVEYKTI